MKPEELLNKFFMLEILDNGRLFICGIPNKIADNKMYFSLCYSLDKSKKMDFGANDDSGYIDISDITKYKAYIPDSDMQKNILKNLFTFIVKCS